MHLLPVTTVSLDEGAEAVDLRQPPGDIVAVSFADSDLAALAAAQDATPPGAPSLRLASLRRLRHPLSVDLWVEATAARARFVLVRCLGGLDYWAYGLERLSEACRAAGVKLAVLPGDDRPDPRLPGFATVPEEVCDGLEAYFRAGGVENMGRLLARIAHEIGAGTAPVLPPLPIPRAFAWDPARGPEEPEAAVARLPTDRPLAHVLVYRSGVLAGDTAAVEAFSGALRARGIEPLILAVSSLKEPEAAAVVARAVDARRPDIILTTTAFAARDETGFVLDNAGCPVLQAIPVGSPREGWEASPRGLSAADLAMQVALPEFDGRLGAGPISFKAEAAPDPALAFARRIQAPDPDGIAHVADLAAAWVRLARTPPPERRLALVLSDYPARGGRAGFAVGLDTPASVCAILDLLAGAGYAVQRGFGVDDLMPLLTGAPFRTPPSALRAPFAPGQGGEGPPREGEGEVPPIPTAFSLPLAGRGLRQNAGSDAGSVAKRRGSGGTAMRCQDSSTTPTPRPSGSLRPRPGGRRPSPQGGGRGASLVVPLPLYQAWLAALPADLQASINDRWGAPEADPAFQDGAFRFPVARAGAVLIALQPDRGHGTDRKSGYHDPDLPPSHGYLAFYCGVRGAEDIHALVHLGTHGTTEWLPGKAVALSGTCWPRLAAGALPVVYPFIVDDPGEAAPAKRRIGAVTVGHLTPAVTETGLTGEAAALRELVEEFSAAQVLDPRRAELVAGEILDRARASGLTAACGVAADTPMDEALTRLDAHLCDLGEVVARDGLHVFGVAREGFEACAAGERAGFLAALDGRFVEPGPAGSPSRGRRDVLPTGRNLATLDPRAIPTRAATELGRRAADEVVRRHLQDHGDWPRRVVMDLWASPTLRSGGEDIAHAMALMGVRPVWDHASTRVTGFEIIPAPLLDRPRADVTVRVSGAFRDTFPDQIALLDAAARAVAALEEDDEWNALAAARRRGEGLARVFGGAPGTYGAGVAARALDGDWQARAELGRTYLEGTSHSFGSGGEAQADGSFAQRVAGAQAHIHVTDVVERDILDGDAAADAVGGFAAAADLTGATPALYSLDTSRPGTPKARTLAQDIDRLVSGRLAHPRWIAGQLRHGWRGAAEIAQGVDALAVFAATTDAVPSTLLDLVFAALLGDEAVRQELEAANPPAAQAIRARLADLRRRDLWTSRLNSVPALLDPLEGLPEAAE